MRILFFSPYYSPYISGLTNYPRQLFLFLSKKHQITVLTFQYQKNLKKEEMINGVRVVRLPYWWRVSKGFISPQSWLAFWTMINQHDLVLLNLPSAEGLPLAIMTKLQNKPLRAIFLCQVNLGSGVVNQMISWMLKQVVTIQLLLADRLVSLTYDYVKSLNLPPRIMRKMVYILPPILSHPIDAKYYRKLKEIKKKRIWVGFVGRVAREKGLNYLVKALQLLSAKKTVTVVFAGLYGAKVVGEADSFEHLCNQLRKSGIDYHFFGQLNDKQLRAFYGAIDVLALPSINQTEAFGLVQLEAMQYGVPVVTTNLPGVRVPVWLTGMGRIVEPQDEIALAKALEEVLDNPHYFRSKVRQNKVKKITNINQVIADYESQILSV